ncbi:MAG: AMP-binding protein [Acidimicrobiales bacterium]
MIEATHQVDRSQWADLFSERTIGSYVADAAARCADVTAIVDAGERISYGDLFDRVTRVVGGLRRLGVEPGDVALLQLPNWWEASVVIHAVARAGAVVNPVIPIYREHELSFIVDQARPRALVVPHWFRGHDHVAMIRDVLADIDVPPVVVVVRPQGPLPDGFVPFDDLLAAEPDVEDRGSAERIALLLYTSGTTADPKGVLHDHRNLDYENRSIIELFGLDETSTVLGMSPVTHVSGFLYAVLLPAMLGAKAVLLDTWDPVACRQLVDAESCRFTIGATPFLQGLVDDYVTDPGECPIAAFACGGADVPPDLVRQARRVLDAAVVRIYGSSEFSTVTCGRPDDDERIAAETDGRPIGPIECRIDHPDGHGVGELLARGPEVFGGYLDPSLNDAAFTDDGWFRTGDLASMDADGAVTIRGRLKDIIIRGGENISAKEVEDLLYGHPAVKEVAVVAMADPVMTERACAFVVPMAGESPTLADLTAYLETRHIARQKYPERLELVDELPKTASGKIQKFVLREWVRGAP